MMTCRSKLEAISMDHRHAVNRLHLPRLFERSPGETQVVFGFNFSVFLAPPRQESLGRIIAEKTPNALPDSRAASKQPLM